MLNIYKVEFCIGTLLSLEKELNVPLDSLLFELEVTPEIQKAIFYHGIKRSTKLGRKKIYEIYDNLSKTDRLRVDMKVNGKLLDSFGVGKQRERNEDVPQETEVKFFSEYMMKFMFYMMGAVGMSKEDFMKSTPSEVFDIAEAYKKEQEFQFKLKQLAHINAIGMTSSKKFKEINPFDTRSNKKVRKVNQEEKRKELEFLMSR